MFLSLSKSFWLPTRVKWLFQAIRWPQTSQNNNVPKVQGIQAKFEVSPLRFVGFCLWLGPGPRVPRLHTAAFGSARRPRFRGQGAPQGQGGRGCEEQCGPWPRTRIGGGNLMRHGIPLWGEVNEDVDGSCFLWSRLHPILKVRILRSDLLLSKGSSRAIARHPHYSPKTAPELAEFPFWCEVMWELHLCRSHYLNQSCFLVTARLVRPCSASYMKYHEQRNKSRDRFQMMWCPNHGWIYLLELEYVRAYPSTSWLPDTASIEH